MSENFAVVYKHACKFRRNNCTELYQKSPLSFLDYQKMCPERTHLVRGDTAPVCDLCGKQHGAKGCLEAVNFKRVVDESDAVLRGSSDILVLGQKVLAELAKHKDTGVVKPASILPNRTRHIWHRMIQMTMTMGQRYKKRFRRPQMV
jgi:hypothetical protein